MPRTCTICTHAEREAIDAALVAGQTWRSITERYGVSAGAIARHKDAHIPAALAMAKGAVEAARSDTLLEQVTDLQTRTCTILSRAENAGDLRTALLAIGEARRNLELLGKLAGELQSGANVLVLAPGWEGMRSAIMTALAAYPTARVAVASVLELEAGGTNGSTNRDSRA